MAYPSLADYAQAVRDYPHISILDSKLKGGAAKKGPNNQLESISGGFSIVFPFEVGANTFALRCWIRDIRDVETRYQEISNYLKQKNLSYFVDFEFVPKGILVNGDRWPITRMEWAEGVTLCQFIKSNLHAPEVLSKAASKFAKMVETLHAHQISHGDLQDGNILLKRNGTEVEIKLIDYDSLFVPALQGHPDTIVGLAEYQHPSRIAGGGTANEKVDYFSELVVYLSLIALAEKPNLWGQFGQRSEKGLLFVVEDFKNPDQSDIFRELDKLSSDVKLLASKLKGYCEKSSIDQLEPLETLLLRSAPSAKAACERGRDFLRSKRYTDALAEFEKAIRIDSKSMEAHHGLGIAYLQINNLESARRKAEEALKIDANYRPALEVLETVKRKQNALASNFTGSGSSPPPTSQHASSRPTHQNPSHERSLRRHYFYRGLAVVFVVCVVFVLLAMSSMNETIQKLRGQLSDSDLQLASVKNDNQTLQERNSVLHDKNQELRDTLSENETLITSLRNENQRLNDESLTVPRPDYETQNSVNGQHAKLALLSSENQDLRNENNTLNIQKEKLEEQITLLKTELASQTEENRTAQIENARLLRQNRDLQVRIKNGERESTLPESNDQTGMELVEKELPTKELPPLLIHTNWVRSVAFSPDGKTLASGSNDSTVRLWNVVLGNHSRTLRGHKMSVNSVAFSPDGQTLASGSADHTIRLWDIGTKTNKLTLKGHTTWVSSVVFSPDGRTLASGSGDNTIRLWNVATGMHKHKFKGHKSWVSSVAFSPDGRMLASGSADHTIRLWNVGTGKRNLTLSGHTELVLSVVFSPAGETLASGSGDGTIRLWDVGRGKHKRTLRGHSDWVRSVAFSPDGQKLVSGGEDTAIRLWNVVTGKFKRTISGHTGPVLSVTFSPDGETIASGSVDKTIRLWKFPP